MLVIFGIFYKKSEFDINFEVSNSEKEVNEMTSKISVALNF